VICPLTVGTLFAIAKVSWKAVLTNSMEKVEGSVVAAVHMSVTVPPVVQPSGVLTVKVAATKGRASKRALSLANMLES
jgi:hypothetical protein